MNFRLSHLRTTNVGACPKEKQNKCHNDFFWKASLSLASSLWVKSDKYATYNYNRKWIAKLRLSLLHIKYHDFNYCMHKKKHAYLNFFISHLVLAEGSKINTKVDCGRGLIQLAMFIIVCRTVQFKEETNPFRFTNTVWLSLIRLLLITQNFNDTNL